MFRRYERLAWKNNIIEGDCKFLIESAPIKGSMSEYIWETQDRVMWKLIKEIV